MIPDLSIVIVNFNTARFMPRLIESIRAQEWTIDGRPGRWELIIVDNASMGDDAAQIAPFLDDQIFYVQNTINVGYGQANNQGFAASRGPIHMILNPDTVFLPGCFAALVDFVSDHPDALVGPLAYMDPEARCMMPPNEMPTPDLFARQTEGQTDATVAEQNMRERTRFSYEYWAATGPHRMDMLSGSCLVCRRELFEGEPPFDPGFPLYYEDTDMFMRLESRGKKLFHLPQARMLHFWSQSADTHQRGADYRCRVSARRFYLKYFGEDGLKTWQENTARAIETKEKGTHISPFEFESLEADQTAPIFPVDPRHENYYIEFSGNPIFTLAVGMFPAEPGDFSVSQVMWDQLGPGNYWIRMIDRDTLETVHAWVLTKRPYGV